MLIVLLGAPGAGKGTQAQMLAARLGMLHLGTGDLLRVEAAAGTALGRLASSYMDRGDLVPDDVMISMIQARLSAPGGQGILLDGFPRTLAQARALDKALGDTGRQVDLALFLRVPDDELVRRLAARATCPGCGRVYAAAAGPSGSDMRCEDCGATLTRREDDRSEAVRHRLEVYAEQTAPVLDHYREAGSLHGVDGEGPAEEVGEALARVVSLAGASAGETLQL
ncbi:MAG: adenylate kinase [Dehalococcoidia bacterium]